MTIPFDPRPGVAYGDFEFDGHVFVVTAVLNGSTSLYVFLNNQKAGPLVATVRKPGSSRRTEFGELWANNSPEWQEAIHNRAIEIAGAAQPRGAQT